MTFLANSTGEGNLGRVHTPSSDASLYANDLEIGHVKINLDGFVVVAQGGESDAITNSLVVAAQGDYLLQESITLGARIDGLGNWTVYGPSTPSKSNLINLSARFSYLARTDIWQAVQQAIDVSAPSIIRSLSRELMCGPGIFPPCAPPVGSLGITAAD